MNIVRELRKKRGIQQKELALVIGVAQPTVSEWEKNKKDPGGENLKKLAKYFGVDELMILGKGVVDLTKEAPETPKTLEAQIVSFGMDNLPKDEREKILSVLQAMYQNKPGLFVKGDENES